MKVTKDAHSRRLLDV